MKISDLSPELQSLAHKRQIEQGNDGEFEGELEMNALYGNFDWMATKEGNDFWYEVNNYKDITNHPMYPKELTKEEIRVERDASVVACVKAEIEYSKQQLDSLLNQFANHLLVNKIKLKDSNQIAEIVIKYLK